ncbi:CBS domain containing protein [uncultured delta proteobacterium]|uniref:CBS domain containing protein n=1 Tax=uncultured delta proteobacterium TaxID=34034 RepID=A0A212JM37_9DELT|nr:CBS domain containing protein [uncultured delta proteobacterium]
MEEGSESSIWTRISRLFQAKGSTDSVEQAIIEASEDGELEKEEGSMLLSVLHLDDLQVQDIMTPRTDVACAPVTATTAEIVDLILSTGHSRIPIFSDNPDNIVGVIYAKDLLRLTIDPSLRERPVTEMMHEPFFVPETKSAPALLHDFKTNKKHLAVILDEYGGTAGIATIEDVIEQIVGDIEDEHDTPRLEDIILEGGGKAVLSGRADLEDIAKEMGVAIESDEVDTIGGYLCHIAGRVPLPGERFTVAGTVFTVLDADAKKIQSIRAEPAAPRQEAELAEENSLTHSS